MSTKRPSAPSGAAQTTSANALTADRTETVYRKLHAAIVAHRLPPGARLPEEQVADAFGVSRTLVRQALLRLAHDHLVVQEPNRGVRIAEPSIAEVRQIYEVRRLIECGLVEQVAGRLGRQRIASLKRLVAREARANASGDVRLAMQLASDFHTELASVLGNAVLDAILKELIARGNVAIAVYEQAGRATCRCDEHRQIVMALAEGDAASAAAIMASHLSAIADNLTATRTRRDVVDIVAVLAEMEGT